jgi:superfamily II DNA or RNA helicase
MQIASGAPACHPSWQVVGLAVFWFLASDFWLLTTGFLLILILHPPMDFKISSDYQPRGDQVTAIRELVDGVQQRQKHQVLLGVTGSGKTFTMAKVVEAVNRPTLVLAHNKTPAAQL